MESFFKNAAKLFPLGEEMTLNASFLFTLDYEGEEKLELALAGVSDYQVYLNGELLHYGPARSAFHFYQVDKVALKGNRHNRLVIILSNYQCLSFTRVKEDGFLCAEIFSQSGESLYSTKDFLCYRNEARIRKVIRFSYQREFSESYRLDKGIFDSIFSYKGRVPFAKMTLKYVVSYGEFWERKTHYATLECYPTSLVETGTFEIDQNAKPYDDRYIHSHFLGIFSPEEWDVDSNKVASSLKPFSLTSKKTVLKKGEFSTFEGKASKTGFLHFELSVKSKKALIYVLFDEIDTNGSGEGPLGVLYYRNTTHNVLTYELGEGEYSLSSFEPYTAKLIRIFVLEGEANVRNVCIKLFENPDAKRLSFHFANPDLETIVNAGVNTFAQNAVDILMDCPSRERAGWLCDTFFSGPAENLITGDNLVEESFLRNYSHYQNRGDQPRGMLPMCYPCDFGDKGFIVNWPMFYILEIGNYLRRHDAPNLLSEAKEGIFAFLNYCKSFENEDELLEFEDIHLFVEWSHANDRESLFGVNHPTNMLYASCLEEAGMLYGKNELVEQAKRIRKKIVELSYDGLFFEDNSLRDEQGNYVRSGRVCETTQYYAFAFGLASKKSFPILFETVKNKLGPKRDPKKTLPNVFPSNMFIGDYLRLYSFAKEGEYETLEKEILDYALQMAKKTGTIWEFDNTYASLTHCFASYVVNLLLEAISGIRLISEKEKTVYLSKAKAFDVGAFEMKIPTPNGYLVCRKGTGEEVQLLLPKGYSVKMQ